MNRGLGIRFTAETNQLYRVEAQGADGIWQPYGSPVLGEQKSGIVVVDYSEADDFQKLRVIRVSDGEAVDFESREATSHLTFQSGIDVPHVLQSSDSLAPGSWQDVGEDARFTGDGELQEWFLPVQGTSFFRIQEE